MMHQSKKLNLSIAAGLFLIAAVFLAYGIYMISYSLDYVRTYSELSTISPDNAFQYVVTSSAVYIGFAVVIFTGGVLVLYAGKVSSIPNEKTYSSDSSIRNTLKKQSSDIDAHPENNPYYVSPSSEHTDEISEKETSAPPEEENAESNRISTLRIKDIFENK